ncbi:MAG TPA: hypothetical protein DCL76_00130, partial [Chloroflexi bacterium]|nr:hypothetical protein [Chloroflexota bacterium]
MVNFSVGRSALALVLFVACLGLMGDAAGKDPEWTYDNDTDVDDVDISDDGKYLVSSGDGIYFFETANNTPDWTYDTDYESSFADITPNGYHVATLGGGDDLRLFNRDSNSPNWTVSTSGYAVAISDDGNYIVSGQSSSTSTGYDVVALYATNSSTPIWTYDTNAGSIIALDITPNASKIVVGTGGGYYFEFNRNSSTPVVSLNADGNSVQSVAISDNGEYIVAGMQQSSGNGPSQWNRIYLFKSGNEDYLDYTGSSGQAVRAVAINSNGSLFASCTRASLELFSKNSDDEMVEEWTNGGGCRPGQDSAQTVAMSRGGDYIVTTSDSGGYGLNFFSKDSSTPLWSGTGFDNYPGASISISSNGQHIAFSWDDEVYYYKNHLPVATINNVSSSNIVFGDSITFNGSATDSDGSVSKYEWSSSIDGILSNQTSFSTSSLSSGTHLIKFRAQDNHTFWSEYT